MSSFAAGDQFLENQLYTVRDVIAGRVDTSSEDGHATVSVVVTPEADIDLVSQQLIDLLTPKLNQMASHTLDLKITPLGEIDGALTVSADADVDAAPATIDPAAVATVHELSERVVLDGVVGAVQEGRLSVEVALRTPQGLVAAGTWTASAVAPARPRAVAEATIAALADVAVIEPCFVEVAEIVQRGDRSVAFVVLILGDDGPDEVVAGSAVVKGSGTADAVARAVLHALNRRMNVGRGSGH